MLLLMLLLTLSTARSLRSRWGWADAAVLAADAATAAAELMNDPQSNTEPALQKKIE
jgi:hypothetical protein